MLIVGLLIGYSINDRGYEGSLSNAHVMPNGHMMQNSGAMNMNDMMASMNGNLIGKTGDDFDRAFLSEMIVHHLGAVQMAELVASSSKHQEIKDLAKNIIEAQNREINDMKSWQKTWYNQ